MNDGNDDEAAEEILLASSILWWCRLTAAAAAGCFTAVLLIPWGLSSVLIDQGAGSSGFEAKKDLLSVFY